MLNQMKLHVEKSDTSSPLCKRGAQREPSVSLSDLELLTCDSTTNSAVDLGTEISGEQAREMEEDNHVHIHQVPSDGMFVN